MSKPPSKRIFGKERPIGTIISSILLFIAGIFSIWVTVPSLVPFFKFSGILEAVITVFFFVSGFLIFRVDNLEAGTFIALGLGLTFTLFSLSSMTIDLTLLFEGIIPLIAGIVGFRTQRESRRTIWLSRVRGFWFEFSHNKIGLLGLALLLFFVFVAILQGPIAALSYPSPDTENLAENYAKPSWIGIIDPSSRNLPPTLSYHLQWTWNNNTLPQNVTAAQNGDMFIISYNRTDQQEIVVPLNATFQYPYVPPYSSYFQFQWAASPVSAKYSLELNLTTPSGKTYPLWDQHWWAYMQSSCFLSNPDYPNPPYDTAPLQWWQPYGLMFYPGSPDYQAFFEDQPHPWSTKLYDRAGYDVYDAYYGGKVPLWDSVLGVQSVSYASQNIYPAYRLGYKGWDTQAMVHDLFSPAGTFSFQMYVTIVTTSETGSCQVNVSNLNMRIPGLLWGLLGCDYSGHDCWARLVYGARTSLLVGLSTAVIATSIGVLVGIVAGYTGGLVDEVLMRFVDVMLCIPLLPLLMILVTFFGRSILYIVLLIAVFGWLGLARLVRSQVLSIREAPFIDCAKASGGSSSYIMIKHLVPNVLPIALADFILSVPGAILLEAALSFIGFGDVSAPTWGREYALMQEQGGVSTPSQGVLWWWFIPPGLAITLICVGFVFIGHAVDEIVNPRLRRRR